MSKILRSDEIILIFIICKLQKKNIIQNVMIHFLNDLIDSELKRLQMDFLLNVEL